MMLLSSDPSAVALFHVFYMFLQSFGQRNSICCGIKLPQDWAVFKRRLLPGEFNGRPWKGGPVQRHWDAKCIASAIGLIAASRAAFN
jgi:hypothetical protein